MRLTISAVIPVYNGRAFLAEAIASIREQTRAVDEVIVVDDASQDGSAELAESLGARVFRMPMNGGPGSARNLGVEHARGDVVAFLDADDLWLPKHCERLADLLERHSSAVLSFSRARAKEPASALAVTDVPDGEPIDALVPLLRWSFVFQSATMVRRATFRASTGYQPGMRHAEDYDLWLRLSMLGAFVGTRAATVLWRSHPAQASRATIKMRDGAWGARRRILDELTSQARAGAAPRVPQDELDRALLRGWERELREAWNSNDTTVLDHALSFHQQVPGSRETYRAWMRRRQLMWKPRLAARTLWHVLPSSLRGAIRPPRFEWDSPVT